MEIPRRYPDSIDTEQMMPSCEDGMGLGGDNGNFCWRGCPIGTAQLGSRFSPTCVAALATGQTVLFYPAINIHTTIHTPISYATR